VSASAETATETQAVRIARWRRLAAATDGQDRKLSLADGVSRRLDALWRTGGADGSTARGRRPAVIHLRPRYVWRPEESDPEPTAARLARNQGLMLRLHLLMLFDARCRAAVGAEPSRVRRIVRRADDTWPGWRELVLTDVHATDRRGGEGRAPRKAAALRRRQITEALLDLEEQHLIDLPRHAISGNRRYNDMRLLSEVGSPEAPAYTVPSAGVPIPYRFFTNLWIWVLSDAEIAVYLALLETRAKRQAQHAQHGVFITSDDQETHYAIHRSTWRTADMLFRLRLIDRLPAPGRTGRIGDPRQLAADGKKPVVRYRINDEALESDALTRALQVLTEPTDADRIRAEHGPLAEQEFLTNPNPTPPTVSQFLGLTEP
jgi:hypothetical protein